MPSPRVGFLVATIAGALSLVAASCAGDSSTAPTSSPAQRIVFQSRRATGMPNLFVMNQSGDSVRAVLTESAVDESPVLSPDASRIAFSSDRDGRTRIWVVNLDGSGLARVTDDTFPDTQPSWSPDGARLVFTRSANVSGGYAGLRTVRPDGSDIQVVTTAQGDQMAAWSPDGSRIAFSRGGKIMVVGPDGSGIQQLTDSILVAGDPAWSPDGARISFSGIAPGQEQSDIFVMHADGSGQVNLTATPTMGEAQPAWSPDGAFIVFAGARRFDAGHYLGNLEIVRRAADGSAEVILTDSPAEDLHPSWAKSPR